MHRFIPYANLWSQFVKMDFGVCVCVLHWKWTRNMNSEGRVRGSCPGATAVSRYLPLWRQTGSNMWSPLPSRFPPRSFPHEGNNQPSPTSFSGMCACVCRGPGSVDGSHWLTGGFDSLAFAEAVNRQLSIATVSHSFGHPFVGSVSVSLWLPVLAVFQQLNPKMTYVFFPP